MKTWMIVVLSCAVLILGSVVYSVSTGGLAVETAVMQQQDIREFVDERGKTRLPRTYLVTMPYEGRIEQIDLPEGTPVKKEQVIARVVPRDLDLNLQAATKAVERLEASIEESKDVSVESTGLEQSLKYVESMDRTVEAAKKRVDAGQARFDYAEKNLTRIEGLYTKKVRTEDDVDQARMAYVTNNSDYQQDVLVLRALEAMQAATALMPTGIKQYIERKTLSRAVVEKQREEALVMLEQAKKNQTRGTMRSPVDGIVLERAISDERQLAAGTVLLKIGRLEDIEVEVDILSQEVVNVKVGNLAEVYGPAIGAERARAKVKTIYPAGFTKVSSLGVEQQRVKVVLEFAPGELERIRKERELGVDYRVRVAIFTAEEKQAFVIPRSALFKGAAGQWQVFAVRGGRAEQCVVEIGLLNDDQVQIVKGLQPREEIVLAPETNLTSGARVQATRKEYLPMTVHSGD